VAEINVLTDPVLLGESKFLHSYSSLLASLVTTRCSLLVFIRVNIQKMPYLVRIPTIDLDTASVVPSSLVDSAGRNAAPTPADSR